MKTAIFLYEAEQLSSLDALIEKYSVDDTPIIVSLDAEIDYELEKRKIPFLSGAKLQNRTEPTIFIKAAEFTHDICASEVLSNLRYRNIPIFELLRFSLHHYFFALLTRIQVITNAVDSLQVHRIVVPESCEVILPTSGFFAEPQAFTCVQAARKVAESRGIAFEMVKNTASAERMKQKIRMAIFVSQRAIFSCAVTLFNTIMSLRRRGKVRLVVSDYWRNIAPVAQLMPEAQIILIDRTEALNAGWKNIWRHRMHFVHLEQFVPYREHNAIQHFVRESSDVWKKRPTVWSNNDFMFCGISLLPECEGIVETFIKRAVPPASSDIAGAYAMYEQLAPDAVWLRVSGISRQTHFSILPLVAKELGIPSLELQHGIEYFGPGSATRHLAQYIALYGVAVAREFETVGYAPEQLLSVGSPRFDSYTKKIKRTIKDREGIHILSTIPGINSIERFGAYSIEEHFAAVGEALKALPQARLIVTSRNINKISFLYEAMERGLQGTPYEFVGTTPLPKLFDDADVFFCGFSTVIYESLLHGLPTVLVALTPVERLMMGHNFAKFEEMGALAIARSPQELKNILERLNSFEERTRMSEAGQKFMEDNFSFDGHATERIAERIRNWSKRTTV